ncbi:MAG: alpha/beta hydrolase [Paludibacter sp.]
MISGSAKITIKVLEILNFKKMVVKSFQKPSRSKKPLIPKHLQKKFRINEFFISGKSVVTIQPHEKVENIHVVYFHGGAYLLEGSSMHWKIVQTIATKANCKVSYIDYPLAPENTYKETFDMVQQSFDKLILLYPEDRFMLMGDSAGGGLSLAFAQKLANDNKKVQPEKNILFSPWLDLTMQNPDIKKQVELDKILPLEALINAGKMYSGGDSPGNYLLSPINGNLTNVGKTIVFYGTDELFYPDCKLLQEKVKTLGNFSFHEFPDMQHDWVIFPIPEANEALNLAIEFIKH